MRDIRTKSGFVKNGARLLSLVLCIAFALSALGCTVKETFEQAVADGAEAIGIVKVDKADDIAVDDYTVRETKTVYNDDDDGSVVTMYLTVRKGNKTENADHTWTEVNSYSTYYYRDNNLPRYAVYGILQEGTDEGVELGKYGAGATTPNCVVQVRGASTSMSPQKSYKISLMDNAGAWRSQKTIALNKHVYDRVRFTNKLSYDLIKGIPDMIGLRTQFVHLYVCDQSEDMLNTVFEDYGLFTQVEQPNKTFLKNHGLDSNGQLYKATAFEFRLDDAIKLATDPGYDAQAFEKILEIKGDNDHTKLIAMLNDLNDYSKPIRETFERYFDADNYFTWLAFNILTANVDTQSQNFMLYSPTNSNKWFFIPWDCDGAFKFYWRTVTEGRDTGYETGVSTYWGSILHSRVLSDAGYREKLDEKINELMEFMSREKIESLVKLYTPIIEKYSFSVPDALHLGVTEEEWKAIADEIQYETTRNYEQYLATLEAPMPFFIGTLYKGADGKYILEWSVSYDFDEENIYYSVEIADNSDFTDPIIKETGLRTPMLTLPELAAGQYFIRMSAKNEAGVVQYAFDTYKDVNNVQHRGTIVVIVQADGTIEIMKGSAG